MSLGAFAQGFGNGMNMGRKYKEWKDEDALKQLQAEAFKSVDDASAIEASGAYEKGEDGSYKIKADRLEGAAPGLGDAFRPTSKSDALRDYGQRALQAGLMSPTQEMELQGKAMDFEGKKLGLDSARLNLEHNRELLPMQRAVTKINLTKTQQEEVSRTFMRDVGKRIMAGDFRGVAEFVSDDKNYSDGSKYQYLGQGKDGSHGFARLDADGNVLGKEQFKSPGQLMAFIQANLEPEKALDYWKTVNSENRADAQLRISGGHLGLAQQRYTEEKADREAKRQMENDVRALRKDLASEKDPAKREAIKQQIEDLVGGTRAQNSAPRIATGEDGVTRAIWPDGTQSPVGQLPERGAGPTPGAVLVWDPKLGKMVPKP